MFDIIFNANISNFAYFRTMLHICLFIYKLIEPIIVTQKYITDYEVDIGKARREPLE